MKLIRTIAPVGIGAFCIERFVEEDSGRCKFLVVYDCGKGRRNSTSKALKNIIDQELGVSGKPVDFLFLSHFDNDHINGLSYLLRTGLVNSAETRVFLPLIQAPYLYLYEYINNLHYIEAVNLLKQHRIKIVFVKPDRQFGEEQMREEDNHDPELISGSETIESYTPLILPNSVYAFWKYVPFYLEDNGIYKAFLTYINPNNKYGVTKKDFHNFLLWPDYQKTWLKNMYKRFRYNKRLLFIGVSPINMNAMLLISDMTEVAKIQGTYILNANLPDDVNVLNPLGCSALYTSDVGLYDQQYFNKVSGAIQNYIVGQRAGLFQIPHHASIYCYNSDTFRIMQFNMAFCNCKRFSTNPTYCLQYELDAMTYGKPYAIVDDNPANKLEEEIVIR